MAAGDVDVRVTRPNPKYCASFDGVDDYISLANNKTKLGIFGTEGITISAWVYAKTKGGTATRGIITLGYTFASNGGYNLQLDDDTATNKIQFYTGNTSNLSTTAITQKTWVHVLVTQSSTTKNFYINGVADGTASVTAVALNSNGVQFIGAENNTLAFQKGGLRNIRIYNRVLEQSEITDLAADRNVTTGLVNHWPLISNSNDVINGCNGVDSGVVYQAIDDRLATAIAAQRTAIGGNVSGSYMMTEVNGGDIMHVCIDQHAN